MRSLPPNSIHRFSRLLVTVVLSLACAHQGLAQAAATRPPQPQAGEKKNIEDNSFLAEEAFNQEDRVVQHISQWIRDNAAKSWVFAFTQEWPIGGQLNQLSYTIPFSSFSSAGRGIGDVMLNYRYQAVADEASGVFSSPRLSLVLPTGKSGFGTGSVGVQAVIPVSIRLGDQFITHLDPGYTHFGNARTGTNTRGSVGTLGMAGSLIWLAQERFNVMLEATWAGSATRVNGVDSWDATFFVSPGVRWAYNFPSGLQVVPGVAFPIGVGPSKSQKQMLLYLSFEHPF